MLNISNSGKVQNYESLYLPKPFEQYISSGVCKQARQTTMTHLPDTLVTVSEAVLYMCYVIFLQLFGKICSKVSWYTYFLTCKYKNECYCSILQKG